MPETIRCQCGTIRSLAVGKCPKCGAVYPPPNLEDPTHLTRALNRFCFAQYHQRVDKYQSPHTDDRVGLKCVCGSTVAYGWMSEHVHGLTKLQRQQHAATLAMLMIYE